MSRSGRLLRQALVLGAALLVGCEEGPLAPRTGSITVAVYDGGNPQNPVPNVDIQVTPVGLHERTNSAGKATFEVQPGGYYVDAHVCCAGPGTIDYHEPVTVTAGQASSVTLEACLGCVSATGLAARAVPGAP